VDPQERINFVEWTRAPGAEGRIIICVEGDDPAEFGAAWYSEAEGTQTTVLIRCGGLAGWPVAVIDDYLAKFPSALTADRSLIEQWEAADLAKWIDLFRTRRDDVIVLEIAAGQLREYREQQAFGIFDALRNRNDRAKLDEGLDQVIANIEAFVREHPEYQVKKNPGPGDKQP